MPEKEGAWAREYRQGRAAQVEQQRIANLIAISNSPCLSSAERQWAAGAAFKALRAQEGRADV